VTSNVNLLYLTGVIADAYLLVPANGDPVRFVRRRGEVDEQEGVTVRKPEDIPGWLADRGLPVPGRVLLEDEDISASDWRRLSALFRNRFPDRSCSARCVRSRRRMKSRSSGEPRSGIPNSTASSRGCISPA
jgi:hypothetical protein